MDHLPTELKLRFIKYLDARSFMRFCSLLESDWTWELMLGGRFGWVNGTFRGVPRGRYSLVICYRTGPHIGTLKAIRVTLTTKPGAGSALSVDDSSVLLDRMFNPRPGATEWRYLKYEAVDIGKEAGADAFCDVALSMADHAGTTKFHLDIASVALWNVEEAIPVPGDSIDLDSMMHPDQLESTDRDAPLGPFGPGRTRQPRIGTMGIFPYTQISPAYHVDQQPTPTQQQQNHHQQNQNQNQQQ
eukprot:jgi/Hompol1/1189/HPOL_005538-RA